MPHVWHVRGDEGHCDSFQARSSVLASQPIWYLPLPQQADKKSGASAGAVSVTEFYIRDCAPQEISWTCKRCHAETQRSLDRIASTGQAVIFYIRRSGQHGTLNRRPVLVEEQLNLPGLGGCWSYVV